jgi:hypothetical protein
MTDFGNGSGLEVGRRASPARHPCTARMEAPFYDTLVQTIKGRFRSVGPFYLGLFIHTLSHRFFVSRLSPKC